MKVDKAVCTTDTMTDAESAISYENLLSTLVQKKILAIKRECEAKKVEKQKRKQQNCLGSLIFGNRNDQSNKCDDRIMVGKLNETDKISSQQATETDFNESMRKGDDNETNTAAPSILQGDQTVIEQIDSIVLINCAQFKEMPKENVAMTRRKEATEYQVNVINCASENDNNSTQTCDDSVDGYIDNQSVHEKIGTPNVDNHGDTPSTIKNSTKIIERSSPDKVHKNVIGLEMVESNSTTTNSKSSSIVSQIEINDEIKQKRHKPRARKNSCDMPSPSKRTVLSAPADAISIHDQEQRHQIRLFEAKSISAQASPIFSQRQPYNGTF